MAIINEIGKRFIGASQNVVQKGKDVTESIKISSNISEKEKELNNVYTLIGKMYFELYKNNYIEEMEPQIVAVESLLKEIDKLTSDLPESKLVVKCKKCGTANAKDAKFCLECGSVIEEDSSEYKKCEFCGAEINDSLNFCTSCGHKLKK